jgi:hypothetical protein
VAAICCLRGQSDASTGTGTISTAGTSSVEQQGAAMSPLEEDGTYASDDSADLYESGREALMALLNGIRSAYLTFPLSIAPLAMSKISTAIDACNLKLPFGSQAVASSAGSNSNSNSSSNSISSSGNNSGSNNLQPFSAKQYKEFIDSLKKKETSKLLFRELVEIFTLALID